MREPLEGTTYDGERVCYQCPVPRKKAGNNAAGWRCRFFLAINNGDHVCRGASFCARAHSGPASIAAGEPACVRVAGVVVWFVPDKAP